MTGVQTCALPICSPDENRSSSPYNTPRSPVRSMLDVGDDNASISSASGRKGTSRGSLPVRSMLDIDTPLPPAQPRRSMLDIDSPAPTVQSPTAPSSPVQSRATIKTGTHHPRSMSDSNSIPNFGPRSSGADRLDPTSGYQFSDIHTNNIGQAMPKRNTQAARFQHSVSGSGSIQGDAP